MKRFFANNSLSIVLIALFFIFLVGLALAGYAQQNEQLAMHGQPPESFTSYLGSGEFVEAVFENWESEFLQMGMFVLLTIWFKQKGSADSKEIEGGNRLTHRHRIHYAGLRRGKSAGALSVICCTAAH